MKTKWVLTLLVVVLGAGLYVGQVLATPSSGLTTTILAKSLFDPVNVKGFMLLPDASSQQKGKHHRSKFWRARIKTHGLSDFYVVDNKIAPGGTTGWHSHPGPSLIFVVAGTVTNYMGDDPTCTGESYSAGSGFTDPGGNDVHMLRNEGTVTAETIAVQFLPTGADRRIDKPDPGNCHF
jgi:quercetin dioxygenase-like cupin family protein